MFPKPVLKLAPVVLIAFGALSVLLLVSAGATSGADNARKVSLDFRIDDEITNQPNGPLGKAQWCTENLMLADTAFIDVLVYDVPASRGLSGFSFDVTYEVPLVEILDVDIDGQMLGSAAASGPIDVTTDPLPDDDGDLSVVATDTGTGHESGNGVLARIEVQVWGGGPTILSNFDLEQLTLIDGNGDPLPYDEVFIFGGTVMVASSGSCLYTWPELCGNGYDDDSDSYVDEAPPWPIPADDIDCDGFSDDDEGTIGTNVFHRCWPFLSPDEQWPPDFTGDGVINIGDVLALKPIFGSVVPPTSPRFDIAISGSINIGDVLALKPYFGHDCLG